MYEDFSFSSVPTPPPAVPGFDLEHLTSISGLRLAFTPSAGGYNVTLE
jgi:hypothetical protein